MIIIIATIIIILIIHNNSTYGLRTIESLTNYNCASYALWNKVVLNVFIVIILCIITWGKTLYKKTSIQTWFLSSQPPHHCHQRHLIETRCLELVMECLQMQCPPLKNEAGHLLPANWNQCPLISYDSSHLSENRHAASWIGDPLILLHAIC